MAGAIRTDFNKEVTLQEAFKSELVFTWQSSVERSSLRSHGGKDAGSGYEGHVKTPILGRQWEC